MFRILLVLSAVLLPGQMKQPELFLDLTTAKVVKMDRSRKVWCGSGGGVAVTGMPYQLPEVTLDLKVARVSERRFALGEAMAVDVRLTNTGDKSMTFPWDPDEYVIYGKDCKGLGPAGPEHPNTLAGSLVLELIGSGGKSKIVGGHGLYARMDQPETYRILQPGQSVIIRVGGKFYPPPAGKETRALAGAKRLKLIAVFNLTDSRLANRYKTIRSVNSVELTGVGK